MKKIIAYIDGQYIKIEPHVLEALTPGRFVAHGVFETMLSIGGQVFNKKAHAARMRRGLEYLKISARIPTDAIIEQVITANYFAMSRVRVMVWEEGKKVHRAVMVLPYVLPVQSSWRACLIKTKRPANARLSEVKSLDYGLFSNAQAEAKARGYDEALLLNAKGHIFESSRANVFWIKDGFLYTPPLTSGCLNGITRQSIISHARRCNFPFKEKKLTPQMLKQADQVFLTNSLFGLMPLAKFAGRP